MAPGLVFLLHAGSTFSHSATPAPLKDQTFVLAAQDARRLLHLYLRDLDTLWSGG
jgi:hypothetical protein